MCCYGIRKTSLYHRKKNLPSSSLLFFKDRDKDMFHSWFPPQRFPSTPHPLLSHFWVKLKPGAKNCIRISPMVESGSQACGPCAAALPATFSGSWVGSRTPADTSVWGAAVSKWWLSSLHRNSGPRHSKCLPTHPSRLQCCWAHALVI